MRRLVAGEGGVHERPILETRMRSHCANSEWKPVWGAGNSRNATNERLDMSLAG